LPHHLQTSGVGWLVASVVLVALSIVVFAGGLRGLAVGVTVVDGAVVRSLAGLDAPGLAGTWRALAFLSSWWVINTLGGGLLLALLALRRFRHLIVVLIVTQLLTMVIYDWVGPIAQRPRPFGVVAEVGWGGWALPPVQVTSLAATLVVLLYTLVPEGRWRQLGKLAAAGVVALAGLGRVALGAEAPTDVLVGAVIGVTVPLIFFRLFAPSEVFPITYRRGRAAHLDVTGARGQAIRRGLEDQLGIQVAEVRPFGLAGSAGSTPLRITVKGDPPSYLFAKLYARSHLRADRWYKLGRELLYGRLEDEKPFNTVRRLVQQEDYALRLCRDAGLPSPRPYGVVELTPEREYLLVTEFFDGAVELSEADVDDGVIDGGLQTIRKLWEAGLAHRDIKPANLLVRDRQVLLIDVAFIELRPTPWRQAVDLANMMLCLSCAPAPNASTGEPSASSAWRRSARGSRPPAGWPCPPSSAGCSAPRAGTCTPSSSGCCRPRPGRSRSSAGPCGGSGSWPPWCCCWCWCSTRYGRSTTRRPPRRQQTSATWPVPIWSRSGCWPSRCRQRPWCHAFVPCRPAGQWRR